MIKLEDIKKEGDFRNVLTDPTKKYVDKTELITKILDSGNDPILITAPRRWGKSVNLSMIKDFVEIQIDKQGTALTRENTDTYKIFSHTLKDGNNKIQLNISKGTEIVDKYQGKYPVIYMDLKDCTGDSYETVKNKIQQTISSAFEKHSYLESSDKLREDQKSLISKFINQDDSLNEAQYHQSLKTLSKLLYTHHKQKVWILIDEYDSPINSSLFRCNEDDLEKISHLIRDTLSPALKNNDDLAKGILTGILRIGKSNVFSGLNNLQENSFTDTEYAGLYGFTQEDVDKLLRGLGISEAFEAWEQSFKLQYNGYITEKENQAIYNPFSISNAMKAYKATQQNPIKHKVLQSFWIDSGSSIFSGFKKLFQQEPILSDIQTLVNSDGSIEIELKKSLVLDDFKILKNISDSSQKLEANEHSKTIFLSYLYHAGYLSLKKPISENNIAELIVPNNEIRSELSNQLKSYYIQKYGIQPAEFNNLGKAILNYIDENNKEQAAQQINLTSILENPKIEAVNEHTIHDIIFTSILMQNGDTDKKNSDIWRKSNNQGSRPDITFFYKNEPVILEIKHKKSIDNAINQIQNHYAQHFSEAEKIHLIGINVTDDKKTEIKYKLKRTLGVKVKI